MRVLALDTTTRDGSAAIVEDDRVIAERRGDAARTHGERLPGELAALLDSSRLTWADVELYAVASGPGSFTGLRIGIAAIQGLALVARRPVVGVPALDALAQLASRGREDGATIAAWMDAQRGEVFAALYRVSAAPVFDPGRLLTIEGPTVGAPAATLARWVAQGSLAGAVFTGDGAVAYEAAILTQVPTAVTAAAPPLAGAIGRIAVVRARRGETVGPAGLQPLYVRRPDAEIARDARVAH